MKFKIWENELELDIISKELKFWKKVFTPSVRTFWDMKDLYLDSWELNDSEWLYFMYRWVYLSEEDENLFRENNLRYDITIIIPKIIWEEYNKTYWHFHPVNSSWKKYEEIYQVLHWNALFIQQNDYEVNFTNAFIWDKVIMKESFWHITINPSEENILIMSNIVDDTFDSEYNDFNKFKWWNYYYTINWFEKNTNYKNNLKIIEKEDFELWWDMYEEFLIDPERFNYLH